MNLGLENKVAIVTGAGSGMGKATAVSLAQAGASVMISDINLENAKAVAQELKSAGLSAEAIHTDVSKEKDAIALVDTTIQRFGTLDILVNSAGVSRSLPFVEIDEQEWDRVFNINVKGVYLCCRAAVPHMMQKKYGKIVNFASIAGKEAFPTFVHYSASKFAVMGITQGLAKELASFNINVNAVCPGVIRTNLWEELLDQMSEQQGITREEAFQEFTKDIPLRRPQTPEDIANLVTYLSSDISMNMTGQGINICGGMQYH